MQNVDNCLKKSPLCGEITVFLSFVLILLLALLGTVLESARLSAAKCKADRILDNSMNYTFTQYCRPLWKDYHLLFLEGEASKENEKEKIAAFLENCENESLQFNDKEESKFQLNLLSLNKLRTELDDIIYAGDFKGEIFGHEVTQYMKYQLAEKEEKERKQIIEDISRLNHAFDVIDSQLKAEKQMGRWNQIMLQIISNIEGISVGKNGIQKKWNGKIKTEPVYIKQLCPAKPSQNLVGVNNIEVWNALKGKYVNPTYLLDKIESKLHKLDTARREREEQEKKNQERDRKRDSKNIKEISMFTLKSAEQNILIKKAEQIISLIDKTEILLYELEKEQQRIEPNMNRWENTWKQKKEKLPSNINKKIYEEKISLDNSIHKELLSSDSFSAQAVGMKNCLEENKKILQKVLDLKALTWGDGGQEIKENLALVNSIKNQIKNYHVKELTFNYGDVKLDKEQNPIEAIPHDLADGILSYVVEDTLQISKKKKAVTDNGVLKKNMIDDPFKQNDLEGELDKVGGFNQLYQGNEWLKNGIEKQLNSITLSKYLDKHFKSYLIKEKDEETVLDYEKEYVLAGNNSDKKNLEAIAVRLILMRTLFNYIYLLSDKQAVEKAYLTAQGIVGFTCMEPLVLLTKQTILFIWAAEEGIIDTNALFSGKEVSLWKQKSTFQMDYIDIFRFSRSFVKKKVKNISKYNNCINLTYENYLALFLQLSKRESVLQRTINEIDDNIKLRYDKEFSLKNCIYGFRVSEEYYLAKKFLQLPFVSIMLEDSITGWRIKKSKIQCYS